MKRFYNLVNCFLCLGLVCVLILSVWNLLNREQNFLRVITNISMILSSILLILSLIKYFKSQNKTPDTKQGTVHKQRNLILYIAAFLIPSKDRDFEIGNMLEIYEKDKKRFGQKRALRLLAVDVIKSAYPLVKRAIGLIVRTALRTLGLYKIYKSFWG